AQALLVTFCTNATDAPGLLIPLNQPTVTVGRRADQDVVLPEATVSGHHAVMRWQAGTWLVEDVGSTNGSFADHSYERKKRLSLLHGAEAQLGECRVKLVSFANGSAQHERAKLYLARHDGLTGLLQREPFLRALAEEVAFAKWPGSSAPRRRSRTGGPTRAASERPTILEMLALRRVATRIVELTEMMMIAMIPAVAGRTGHLKFAIGMMGPGIDEARAIVEQVVAQVQGLMPDTLDLDASVVRRDPDHPGEQLLDF